MGAYRADQEKEDDRSTQKGADRTRPEDTPCSSQACVLGLLSDVSRGIKASQDTGGEEERQQPVPASGSTGSIVVGGKERLVLETIGLGHADRQPDQGQSPVEKHNSSRGKEDIAEVSGCGRTIFSNQTPDSYRNRHTMNEVDQNSSPEEELRSSPDDGSEFDVACIESAREVGIDAEH